MRILSRSLLTASGPEFLGLRKESRERPMEKRGAWSTALSLNAVPFCPFDLLVCKD